MEEEEQRRHQATHTANERSDVAHLVNKQCGNSQTTRTVQEFSRINRLVGENHTAFNKYNAQNQRGYQHNQGANTDDEEFNQYLSTFDND